MTKQQRSAQESFWQGSEGEGYVRDNRQFDMEGAREGWRRMLSRAGRIASILECGSNVGRNLEALRGLKPDAE
ncbi:MAG: pseudaminic acid biosynthesis-associated methylase, partial [Candidatus Omnitrophica bacterium]|nr:pseudaminic acid biosynthesis-associated methylase [Candidatus Omnitrophota bacterium]